MQHFEVYYILCLSLVFGFGSGEKVSFDKMVGKTLEQYGGIGINAALSKTMNPIRTYVPLLGDYNNALCRNHSLLYKTNLLTFTPWALRMLDSGSKIPEGMLMGNIVQFGNYDECVSIENIASKSGKFSGQHCMAQIRAPGADIHAMGGMGAVDNYNAQQVVQNKSSMDFFSLRWSLCVPSSCRAKDVQAHLRVAFAPLSVRVDAINCNTRAKEVRFTSLDWFAVVLFTFFGVLVILSTSYDLFYTNPERRLDLFTAFSLYSNGKKLFTASAGRDSLSAVHGVRYLSMMWVVLGHSGILMFTTPAINLLDKLDVNYDWKHIYLTNGTLSVDSFLLLSGLLLCYVFLKEMEAGKPFNVPGFYLHRYIRLTPVVAVVILFTVTLAPYMGDGPFWNFRTQTDKDACLNSWWTSLLYINNYVQVLDMCLTHTWYLSVDMQLFMLSPLILYPLWKHPKLGQVMLCVFFILGLLLAFLVPYVNQFELGENNTMDQYQHTYVTTHTRFTPWLIGIGLGYLLHHTKHQPIHLSPVTVIIGWLLAVALLLTSLLLQHRFIQPEYKYERLFKSLYQCLMRPAWALGLAWIIFACLKGYGGIVNSFLSCRVFLVLGRLTYTLYLVHFPIQTMIYGSTRTTQYLSDRGLLEKYFGQLVLCLAAATILSLIFESPAIIIEKHILKKIAKKREACKRRQRVGISFKENDMNIKEAQSFDNAVFSGIETTKYVTFNLPMVK